MSRRKAFAVFTSMTALQIQNFGQSRHNSHVDGVHLSDSKVPDGGISNMDKTTVMFTARSHSSLENDRSRRFVDSWSNDIGVVSADELDKRQGGLTDIDEISCESP